MSEKILYLECYNGISGDMSVAALLDMGADREVLRQQLSTLPLEGFRTEISRVKKTGLDCCDFHVVLENEYENHDHDIEYLYGHHHGHDHIHEESHHHEHGHAQEEGHHHDHSHTHEDHHHEHGHTQEEGHCHDHSHTHEQDHHHEHGEMHSHVHRGLRDVLEIIEQSQIDDSAKQTASQIFRVLAQAEAKAHGATPETVHFHEVGAVDSIVDIVAFSVCLHNLGITKVIVPELCEGKGTVRCAHGILPIPVPAVLNIVQEHQIRLCMTQTEAELVTPTGAAIVAAVRTSDTLPGKYKVTATGLGAGKRDYGRSSILRAMLIEAETQDQGDVIYKLESNVDDCTGEALGYVMEQLFEKGARDVNYIPVFMKKNRPAYQINIICDEEMVPVMEEVLFRETTTIGVRRVRMERTVLKREFCTVKTSLGTVKVKVCDVGTERRIYPEYESVSALAKEHGMPYPQVFQMVLQEAAHAGL